MSSICFTARTLFFFLKKKCDSSHTRFADLRWAGFSAQMFMRSTELSATTNVSAEHETPPIANVLLAACGSFGSPIIRMLSMSRLLNSLGFLSLCYGS